MPILLLYVKGTRFTLRTDRDLLIWILNVPDNTGGLTRWHLHLSEYDFDAVNRASIKHQATNALSRLRTTGEAQTQLEDDSPVFAIDKQGKGD